MPPAERAVDAYPTTDPLPFLRELFASESRLRLLRAILLDPEPIFWTRKYLPELGVQHRTVWADIQSLERLGMIRRVLEAELAIQPSLLSNKKLYTLVDDHPLVAPLGDLFRTSLASETP